MLRTKAVSIAAVGVRSIVGVAPTLNLSKQEAKLPKAEQVKRNTAIALELIRKFKGTLPEPYQRRHTATIEVVEKEIETLLGGAEKIRKKVTDDQPMDKLSVMERTLRHGLWSYLKDEGRFNFTEMEKWLVYTPSDEQMLATLKHNQEVKSKYAAFKKKRQESGGPDACLPKLNWAKEYSSAIDREVVAEKRFRYELLSATTTERDEAEIENLLKQYRKPIQDRRLDALVDALERFKPVLAREAIMQRLTIKHLEGQLGIWRYLDWNPEVRDRAEVEADQYMQQWWHEGEERRLQGVRLRSRNEVREVMEKSQAKLLAERPESAAAAAPGKSSQREKLLQEIIRIQSRIGKKEEEAPADSHGHGGGSGEKKAVAAVEDDSEKYRVDTNKVKEVGLLGLDFIKAEA